MIKMQGLSFTYQGADKKSLEGINLEVASGECVLVTGKSGCGKSTLTRIMNGLCPKFYGGKLEGDYHLCGKSIEAISLDEIGQYLGSVFQDPRSQFFAKKVRDEIVLAMENHCFSREEMQRRLLEISDFLGLGSLHHRDMQNLSSGEKQKVAIASVCALQPKGLVLDEPSANLDTNSTLQVVSFLSQFKSNGHSLVISEHRLNYFKDIFDRMLILKEGRIVDEYTRKEALSLANKTIIDMGLRLFETPQFEGDKRVHCYENCSLRAEKVSLRLNDNQILQDVSLGFSQGKILGITGSNGAGKTSLCRIVAGIQKESTGAVYVNSLLTKKKKRIRNSFFVQQEVDYQLYTPTVEEEILMASIFKKDSEEFREVVKFLGLDGLLHRHPNTLSGGEKQRVLIAAAILKNNATIILDEPTSGLDGYHMRAVTKILKKIANDGKCIILVTHDTEFIHSVADTLVYMHDKKIKYHTELKI